MNAIQKSKRRWQLNNHAAQLEMMRAWRAKNKDRINAYRRAYMARKDSVRLACNMRNRIRGLLHGRVKSSEATVLLGCSLENFWLYLESKFEEGMTRDNYGKVWHLDHIIPCDLFDLTKPEHQKRSFHFSNLQPLFPQQNWKKHTKTQ